MAGMSNILTPIDTLSNEQKFRIGKTSKDCELFSFSDITTATDSFSLANKLGEGGFGPVHKVNFQIIKFRFLFSIFFDNKPPCVLSKCYVLLSVLCFTSHVKTIHKFYKSC